VISPNIPNGWLDFDPHFLPPAEAEHFFQRLRTEIDWKEETILMFGKEVMQPRLVAWYGDPGTSYTYSGRTMHPRPWSPPLLDLKTRIEAVSGHAFNSVLLNLYRHGKDSMGWHSDNEPELGKNPFIASLSLGSARRFHLKHTSRSEVERIRLDLTHGSLLLMGGEMQHHWQHQISKTAKDVGERINLTFRLIVS
jgi:alkylated DNA repair dioxygenase AlkB